MTKFKPQPLDPLRRVSALDREIQRVEFHVRTLGRTAATIPPVRWLVEAIEFSLRWVSRRI
jgi:hypothetical protein